MRLPLAGAPEQRIEPARAVRSVAVLGCDYHGMKPTMAVQVGDRVRLGQVLFSDRKPRRAFHRAGCWRGQCHPSRRAAPLLQSVVIYLEGDGAVEFARYDAAQLPALDLQAVRDNLQQSGLWTALRTRPFSKVPAVDAVPSSIFVTAIDTHPLAADPAVVIGERPADFANGLAVLARLGQVHLCKASGVGLSARCRRMSSLTSLPARIRPVWPVPIFISLTPVSAGKSVWQIGYQDVIAIGALFQPCQLDVTCVVALGGPVVDKPRLLRTRLGASLEELTAGELQAGSNRIISGSVLGGRTSRGAFAFLGRYHVQVSCLHEGRERELLHYLRAGVNKHFGAEHLRFQADGRAQAGHGHQHQRQPARHGAGRATTRR